MPVGAHAHGDRLARRERVRRHACARGQRDLRAGGLRGANDGRRRTHAGGIEWQITTEAASVGGIEANLRTDKRKVT